MAALVFPLAPALNEIFPDPAVAGIPQWKWSGSRWDVVFEVGGASVTISATAPAGAAIGSLWWDLVGAQLYLWTGAEWIVVVNLPGGGSGDFVTQEQLAEAIGAPTHTGPTPPSNPRDGDLWLNTSVDPPALNVWNGSSWVLSTTPATGFLPLTGGAVSGPVQIAGRVNLGQTLSVAGVFNTNSNAVFNGSLGLSFGANYYRLAWASNALGLHVDGTSQGYLVRSNSTGGFTPLMEMRLNPGANQIWAWYDLTGNQYATINVALVSDRRRKSNIAKSVLDALGAINKLGVYSADVTQPLPGAKAEHWDYSLMADEVGEVIPNARVEGGASGYDSIRELPLIATLVRAVQQLSARVEQLESAHG